MHLITLNIPVNFGLDWYPILFSILKPAFLPNLFALGLVSNLVIPSHVDISETDRIGFGFWLVPIIGTLVQQPSIPHKASWLNCVNFSMTGFQNTEVRLKLPYSVNCMLYTGCQTLKFHWNCSGYCMLYPITLQKCLIDIHVSMPQCFMFMCLLKSDGDTPQRKWNKSCSTYLG